jgi:hypothetical protein
MFWPNNYIMAPATTPAACWNLIVAHYQIAATIDAISTSLAITNVHIDTIEDYVGPAKAIDRACLDDYMLGQSGQAGRLEHGYLLP